MRATHHVRDSFAHNADHLAHDTPLSAFFAEVVCTLGATPPRTATSPPPNRGNCAVRGARSSLAHVEGVAKRGNCTIRAATRRRHAVGRLLMVQNPHRQRCDALRKGQRARSGPGAACFPMTPLTNGGKCTMRGARSGSPHVEGATKRGNCTIRAATRRRHAVGRLLMVQNPPSPKMRSKTLYPTADSPHHDGTPVSNDDEFP